MNLSSLDLRAGSSEDMEGADVASVSAVWWEKTESVAVYLEDLLKLLKFVPAEMGVVGLAAADVD